MLLYEGKHFTFQTWACWTRFEFGVEWNFLKDYKNLTITIGFWSFDVDWWRKTIVQNKKAK